MQVTTGSIFVIIAFLCLLLCCTLSEGPVKHCITANMKRFLDKAKSALDKRGSGQQRTEDAPIQDSSATIQPPTIADVTRYRYHHGTNLGSTLR